MTCSMTQPVNWEAPARAMISLVAAMDPAALAELRRQFPANSSLFDSTYVLGEGTDKAGSDVSTQSAMKALIETTLHAGDGGAKAIVSALSRRMRRVRHTRFAAVLATTVAGTLTGAPVLGASLPVPALLGPILALMGATLMLISEHADKPLAGAQRSLSDLLADTLVAEATFADVRLRMLSEDLNRDGTLLELARRVSEAAAKLRHVSVFGGVPIGTATYSVRASEGGLG